MKRKAFFPKTLASLLAIAMLFAALPGIGSSALMQGTRSATFTVGKNAKEFEGTDGSVVLDKNAYLTANGTYSIELSAFVTGEDITAETVTITESKPVDIILVVDQSGSMQDSSGGYGHMTATKNTITSFLDGLTDAKLDHRIAIVGYSNGLDEEDAAELMYSNSPTLNPNYHNYRFRGTGVYDGADFYRYQEDGYTTPLEKGEVKDSAGKVVCTCNDAGLATDEQYANALKNLNTERATIDASINAITHYASTFMSYGLKMAQKIVDNRTEQDRPAVVILFTDGNPGNMGFSVKDAAASVNAATRLKKNDKVKIFTVGLLASSYFDDRHSFADGMGVTITGMKKNSTSATAPIFPYSYEAPTNTRMFITDSTIKFTLSGGFWARQNTYSAVDNYPDEPWARDVWSMSYTGDMITTKQATSMGIEENFLVRDLLCIISSDYENVSAGIYNMKEMYDTFGTGAAPTNDKTNASNGTLPNGYLWPAYTKAANIGLIMDIGKCVAYYQEGTTNLVAGDYWRAAFYNGTYYQFSYTDGVKDHAKKYYMMTDGHGDTEAANEALLKDVFNMIENVVTTEIVTGGGHPAGIDASTVLCDQLSDLFTLEDAQLSIKAYTQNYMGDESGKPSFATEMTEITNSLNVKFDRNTGKIAVSGFDYSANFVHYDENHQPKGCRLLVF